MDKIKALPDILPSVKFNLTAQEQFGNDRGILFVHWVAIPSSVGLKDRGDLRRPDTLDTISSNGFLYKKVGTFNATLISNQLAQQQIDAGLYDNSTARLVLPKYYKEVCNNPEQQEIALLPGDRIYCKDLELVVGNYQRVEYNPHGQDHIQFPIKCVSYLIDSRNVEYKQGVHFKIDKDGNLVWIDGKANPGIDPDTGKGRVYSIRYTYLAFWYVHQLINEIRVTNDGEGNAQRLPYHCTIQREYVYYNKVKPVIF